MIIIILTDLYTQLTVRLISQLTYWPAWSSSVSSFRRARMVTFFNWGDHQQVFQVGGAVFEHSDVPDSLDVLEVSVERI